MSDPPEEIKDMDQDWGHELGAASAATDEKQSTGINKLIEQLTNNFALTYKDVKDSRML